MVGNLVTGATPAQQELLVLKKIKREYFNGHYRNMLVLIQNYIGHVPHYKPAKEISEIIVQNFSRSIEDFEAYRKLEKMSIKYPTRYNIHTFDDSFVEFVSHLIFDIEWDVEHGYLE